MLAKLCAVGCRGMFATHLHALLDLRDCGVLPLPGMVEMMMHTQPRPTSSGALTLSRLEPLPFMHTYRF